MKRPPPVTRPPASRSLLHAASLPSLASRLSSFVSRPSPRCRHPAARLEGSSPRRAEQHGSSLPCDGTCFAPSTTVLRGAESTRATPGRAAPCRATPYYAVSRHVAPRRATSSHAALARAVPASTTNRHPPLPLRSRPSASRSNSLRRGVILVHIQSHAHYPLPLLSPPFRSWHETASEKE